MGTYRFIIGSDKVEGRGGKISVFEIDPDSAALTLLNSFDGLYEPGYQAIRKDGQFIYSLASRDSGDGTGGVAALGFDPESGELQVLNQQSCKSPGPCHAMIDQAARTFVTSNYKGGSLSVFPVSADGLLGECTAYHSFDGKSVHPERQEASHVHSAFFDPDNNYLIVQDLGTDLSYVYAYDKDRGQLGELVHRIQAEAGRGPRHFVFHPNGIIAYRVNELISSIDVFDYEPGTGFLLLQQTVSILPADFKSESIAADIRIHPSGKWIYASNRGHDSIACLDVDPDTGKLANLRTVSTRGEHPRNFNLTPDGRFLIVGNLFSEDIQTFVIDPQSGDLSHIASMDIQKPMCLSFLYLD